MRIHLPRWGRAARPPTPAQAPSPRTELIDALVRTPVGDKRMRAYTRNVIPNLMLAAFPVPGLDADLSDLTVYRAVGFCLERARSQETDAAVRAALRRRIAELEVAGGTAMALRVDHDLQETVRRMTVPLSHHKPTLIPGGFLHVDADSVDGHAVALYLLPDPSTEVTRAFVCDRVAGDHAYLLRNRHGKRLPLVWDVPTARLLTPKAMSRWATLMQLQRNTPADNANVYYEELTWLFTEAGGTLRLGMRGRTRVRDLSLAAQSMQKSGTCSWHAIWAYLRVALQCDLGGPDTAWSEARIIELYKRLKETSRAVIRRASQSPGL